MSAFRPAQVVTGPDGRVWEVYVTRFELPAWKPGAYTSVADDLGGVFALARIALLFFIVEIPLFLLFNILVPLLRFVVTLPTAVARGLRTQEIRVEAITFYPWEESHLWVTTRDHLAEVLRQVVRDLRVGEVASPLGAEFRGSRQLVGNSFRGLARDD